MEKHLILVGMPGAGKSYVGNVLAQHYGLPFIDLDQYISRQQKQSIRAIFKDRGEMAFRQIERAALDEVLTLHPVSVIALGGGTPCFYDNMQLAKLHGTTVYLAASVDLLVSRLEKEKHERPMLADLDQLEMPFFLHRMLQARKTFYKKAHFEVNADHLKIRSIVEMFDELLKKPGQENR